MSELPVIVPEKQDDAKRVNEGKLDLVQRSQAHHKTVTSLSDAGFWSSKKTDEKKATVQEEPNLLFCN